MRSTSFGSSSSRMMRITSSRLRKTMSMPASISSRLLDLAQAERRAPQQHDAAVVEPLRQRFAAATRRAASIPSTSTFMFIGKARLELGQTEQRFHHHGGIDRAGARLDDDADVLGRFVADVGDQRQLLVVEQLGDLLDQPRLLHAVGNLGDDGIPHAAAALLLDPAGAQAKRAAAGAVGLGDRLRGDRR